MVNTMLCFIKLSRKGVLDTESPDKDVYSFEIPSKIITIIFFCLNDDKAFCAGMYLNPGEQEDSGF